MSTTDNTFDYFKKRESVKQQYIYRLVTPINQKIAALEKCASYSQKNIMTESTWRGLGINMSLGWVHVGYINNSLVFKKPQDESKQDGKQNDIPDGKQDDHIEVIQSMPLSKRIKLSPNHENITENNSAKYTYLRKLCDLYPIKYPFVQQTDTTHTMHYIIFDWLTEVCKEYNITQDSFSMAGYIYYLFLSKADPIPKDKLQLYGMVSLDIANKIEEDWNVRHINDWKYIADDSYSREEISEASAYVTRVLSGAVVLPSVYRFIHIFMDEYDIHDQYETSLIRYLCNIAIASMIFPKYPSWVVAEVCISMSAEREFVPYDLEIYKACYTDLKAVLNEGHPKKYRSILDDYNDVLQKIDRNTNTDSNELLEDIYGMISDVSDMSDYEIPKYITDYKSMQEKKMDMAVSTDVRSDIIVTSDPKKYNKVEKLGEGTYGFVYRVSNSSSIQSAGKYYKDKNYNDTIDQHVIIEMSIMTIMNHPNLVSANEFCIAKDNNVIYMDLLQSYGDFVNKHRLFMTDIRKQFKQIMLGLVHLHKHDIIHRDLKPANILVDGTQVKITDFGSAIWVRTNKLINYSHSVCTLWYAAPEILLLQDYNKAMDIWSAGCTLIEILLGYAPFRGEHKDDQILLLGSYFNADDVVTRKNDKQKFIKNNKNFSYEQIREIVDRSRYMYMETPELTDNLVNLLVNMLAIDPSYRYTAEQVLAHPFLADT